MRDWWGVILIAILVVALLTAVGLGIAHQVNTHAYIAPDGRICVQEIRGWDNHIIREVCEPRRSR